MKRAMILTICLVLAWCLSTALAVEPDQCVEWNGRVLRVVEVLDGDAVTPIGDGTAQGRYVQLVFNCEGEPLTWGLQRELGAELQDAAGTGYKGNWISGSFAEGASFNINDMDAAEMKPEFTVQFDLPKEIALSDCTLSIGDTAEKAGIPAELVGTWVGTGMPVNGSSPIELEAVVNADGTGEYRFEQSGYIESYPFTISAEDSSFAVNIPADNYLGITECGGTYAFDGEALTLDITTRFNSGRSFSYNAACTKREPEPEASAAEAETAASDSAANIQPVVPNIQPILPDLQSILSNLRFPSILGTGGTAATAQADDAEIEEGTTPEPTAEPTPEPTEEPAPEPETEPDETSDDSSSVNEVLDALDEDVYRTTYDALLSGEIIRSGSKGDAAKGVQQTLVAFGQNIAVDGSVGPKTIAALNAVQAAFGLEATESMDAAVYADLLPRLLIIVYPDEADALLLSQMDSAEYDYMRACAMVAQGRYATAKELFEESGWNDWEARTEACVQPWPKTGQLYKNSDVKGSSTQLTVKFNSDPDIAMLVKVYTTDGTLARTMFIGGTGKATTSLPAGTYIIKDGTGKNWYGEEESFGSEGNYEIMTFEDGQQEVELMKNYTSTITVNVKEFNPDATDVGADWENWRDF